MHSNDRFKSTGFSGFTLKKENLTSSAKASPFQKFVSASQPTLPKFHTDENEKRYLQESGAGVTEEDLYDPLNPTDADESLLQPKLKKKRIKT